MTLAGCAQALGRRTENPRQGYAYTAVLEESTGTAEQRNGTFGADTQRLLQAGADL